MPALQWLKGFYKSNRKLVVTVVAAVALSAGVPVYIANPAVVEQIIQGIENAQDDGSAAALAE